MRRSLLIGTDIVSAEWLEMQDLPVNILQHWHRCEEIASSLRALATSAALASWTEYSDSAAALAAMADRIALNAPHVLTPFVTRLDSRSNWDRFSCFGIKMIGGANGNVGEAPSRTSNRAYSTVFAIRVTPVRGSCWTKGARKPAAETLSGYNSSVRGSSPTHHGRNLSGSSRRTAGS